MIPEENHVFSQDTWAGRGHRNMKAWNMPWQEDSCYIKNRPETIFFKLSPQTVKEQLILELTVYLIKTGTIQH